MDVRPVLRRFQKRILDKGAGNRMKPAAGATVKFYRQGATAKSAASVPFSPPSSPVVVVIPVYHVGEIATDDQVQVGGDGNFSLHVVAVDAEARTVSVVNDELLVTVEVPANGRLILLANPPSVYADPLGTAPLGDSIVADADGWVGSYVRNLHYDVTVPGLTQPAVYADLEGSFVTR